MTLENTSPASARLNFMRMVSAIVEFPKQPETKKTSGAQPSKQSSNKQAQLPTPQA